MKVRASVKPMCEKCKVIRRPVSSGYLRAAPPQAAPGLGEEHGPYCWSGHPARKAHGDRSHLHLWRWPDHRQQVCASTGVDESTRVKDLSEADVNKLRAYIDQNVTVEGTFVVTSPKTSSAKWRSTASRGSATARACPCMVSAPYECSHP